MTPQEIRDANLAILNQHGFRPATWMPLPATPGDTTELGFAGGTLRPAIEIANRLLCHCAAFAWGSAPSRFEQRISGFVSSNDLWPQMTPVEVELLKMPKDDAASEFSQSVGWRLENIWSLAWILGLAEEPSAITGQLSQEVSGALMSLFLPNFTTTAESLLEQGHVQPVAEVIRMEDLFYLAHNAVRSGQTGRPEQLPPGFDPIGDGGAIHERRHSLTWALAPGATWDETDLST